MDVFDPQSVVLVFTPDEARALIDGARGRRAQRIAHIVSCLLSVHEARARLIGSGIDAVRDLALSSRAGAALAEVEQENQRARLHASCA